MNQDIEELKLKFKKIKNIGLCKSLRNGTAGIHWKKRKKFRKN